MTTTIRTTPKLRPRRQLVPLGIVIALGAVTFASAAANLPDHYRTAAEIRRDGQRRVIADRRDRIAALSTYGDHCNAVISHELARALVFDGRSARAYADDYERRCGADAVVRHWGDAPVPKALPALLSER